MEDLADCGFSLRAALLMRQAAPLDCLGLDLFQEKVPVLMGFWWLALLDPSWRPLDRPESREVA